MKPSLRGYLHFLCWLFGHFALPLSSALGSKYTGLSKDSVSGSFMLLENPATALRQHRIPLRKGCEYVKLQNSSIASCISRPSVILFKYCIVRCHLYFIILCGFVFENLTAALCFFRNGVRKFEATFLL